MRTRWPPSAPPRPSFAVLPPNAGGLSRSRKRAGLVMSLVGVPLITAVLVTVRGALELDSVLLIYLLAVVVVAVVGGSAAALFAAL